MEFRVQGLGLRYIPLRLQVPSKHILSQIAQLQDDCPKPKYPSIGYFGPFGQSTGLGFGAGGCRVCSGPGFGYGVWGFVCGLGPFFS